MAGTFTNFLYHIVFSTKNREPIIEETFRERLYEYIGGIFRAKEGTLLTIGGMPDHVHLMVRLKPKEAVSKTIGDMKGNVSKWINDHKLCRRHFGWQVGYGGFSVSESNLGSVKDYVKCQKEHHRTRSFQEEFLALLERHGISYDPDRIWD